MLTQLKVTQLTDYIPYTIDLKLKLKNNQLGNKRAHALNRMLKEAKYLTNETIAYQHNILTQLEDATEEKKKEFLNLKEKLANHQFQDTS